MTTRSESLAVINSSLRRDKSPSSDKRPSISDLSWSTISGSAYTQYHVFITKAKEEKINPLLLSYSPSLPRGFHTDLARFAAPPRPPGPAELLGPSPAAGPLAIRRVLSVAHALPYFVHQHAK